MLPASRSSPGPESPMDGCQIVELSSPRVSLDLQIPLPNQLRQSLFRLMNPNLAVGNQFSGIQWMGRAESEMDQTPGIDTNKRGIFFPSQRDSPIHKDRRIPVVWIGGHSTDPLDQRRAGIFRDARDTVELVQEILQPFHRRSLPVRKKRT